MEDELAVEETGRLLGEGGDEPRDHDVAHILLDAVVHLLVGTELIVLRAEHYGVYAQRLVLF